MDRVRRRIRWKIVALVAVGLLALPATVVAAGGRFTDDETSVFEGNIEWMASAGVTGGCNPPTNSKFCPDDPVTRGQMAAFMQRFAQYLGAEDGTPRQADDSVRLGGFTRGELLSSMGGSRSETAQLGTTADPDRVSTLAEVTMTTNSRQPSVVKLDMSGYAELETNDATLQENHQLACWVSRTKWTTFNAGALETTPSREFLLSGTTGAPVGGMYRYSSLVTISAADFLEAGESATFYFQCADWRNGTGLTELFDVEVSAIATMLPVEAIGLLADDPFGPGVERESVPQVDG